MKAKSFTKRSIKNTHDLVTDLGTRYLLDWTKKELNRYSNVPVVIQIGDYGFLIGRFKITGITKQCWQVIQSDNKLIHNFTTKINAIVYCLYEVSNKHTQANELLDLDLKIGKLDNDIVQYKYSIDNTKQKFKAEIIQNRYIAAVYQQKSLHNILKKTLNLAKYNNFGNTNYEINRNGR